MVVGSHAWGWHVPEKEMQGGSRKMKGRSCKIKDDKSAIIHASDCIWFKDNQALPKAVFLCVLSECAMPHTAFRLICTAKKDCSTKCSFSGSYSNCRLGLKDNLFSECDLHLSGLWPTHYVLFLILTWFSTVVWLIVSVTLSKCLIVWMTFQTIMLVLCTNRK